MFLSSTIWRLPSNPQRLLFHRPGTKWLRSVVVETTSYWLFCICKPLNSRHLPLMEIVESCDLHVWVRNVQKDQNCATLLNWIFNYSFIRVICYLSAKFSFTFIFLSRRRQEKFKLLEEIFYFHQKYSNTGNILILEPFLSEIF